MNNKTIALIAFIILAIVQLFIPAKMIMGREDILQTGKEYKFKTEPVDPSDPLRGKYISLSFKANKFTVTMPDEWKSGEDIFVHLTIAEDGFAKVINVTKTPPDTAETDYIKARVDYISHGTENELYIKYPFERFYMEESKAYAAEQIYNANQADTGKVTYALVNIMDGEAVLKDVMINGVPISQVVKERAEEVGK